MDIKAFTDKRYIWSEVDFKHIPDDLRDFAELCATMHFAVATSENPTISFCRGKVYPHSQNLLIEAIRAGWVSLDPSDIYDVWVDCNESIAYCADVVTRRIADEKAELDNECEGHESVVVDQSFYCDGSCTS